MLIRTVEMHTAGEPVRIVVDVAYSEAPDASRNACVFADRQVDRNPTGSGVTARMALRHARGSVRAGDTCRFAGITGNEFTATVVTEHPAGTHAPDGLVSVEADDPLRDGFLLR